MRQITEAEYRWFKRMRRVLLFDFCLLCVLVVLLAMTSTLLWKARHP